MNITEHAIFDANTPSLDQAISDLLTVCFDNAHEGRTYYKQLPQVRLVAWDGQAAVGHVGLEYRNIRVGDQMIPIMGIIDLCVAPEHRRQGIGAKLLGQAAARSKGQSFAMAMADEHSLYVQQGYDLAPDDDVTFLAIDELRCHSVIQRDLNKIMMVKPLTDTQWPKGPVDMLGYLF